MDEQENGVHEPRINQIPTQMRNDDDLLEEPERTDRRVRDGRRYYSTVFPLNPTTSTDKYSQ